MKNVFLTVCCLSVLLFFNTPTLLAQSPQVTIYGKVIDATTGEPLFGANIIIEGTKIGTTVDVDGSYSLLWHQEKEVVLECSYIGYRTEKQTVEILYLREVEVNFQMQSAIELDEVVVMDYNVPLVEKDHVMMGKTVTSEEIKRRPVRGVNGLTASTVGVKSSDDEGSLTIRGSRSEASDYYMDGVRVKERKSKSKSKKRIFGKTSAMKEMPEPTESGKFSPPTLAATADVESMEEEINPDLTAGTLTAGEIHDFSKWELWQDIATEDLHQWETHWNFHLTDRYTVQVLNNQGFPMVNATVELKTNNKTIWAAKTDNTGKAELWNNVFTNEKNAPKADKISVKYNGKKHEIQQLIPFNQGVNFLKIEENCQENAVLDIAFVVDATGSMGDEIAYLQTELKDVIEKIQAQRADLTINLGSVFYKDETDTYVTRKDEFTNDIGKAIQFMQAQQAGGGGDYPEAMDAALDVALNELNWSDKTVAKLLFLVLDAPPHYTPEILQKLEKLTHLAAKKGVRIIPVAGSGIDKSTEYLMRSFALTTNGTYVFLTDHSGVGNPHIEPTTDEYEVEKFNDLLIRVIGQFTEVANCDQPIASIIDPADNGENPKQIAKNSLVCYPNPTTGVFKVNLEKAVKELFITDLSGKILLRFDELEGGETEVNLANFPNGTYFVRVSDKDRLRTGKVILNY